MMTRLRRFCRFKDNRTKYGQSSVMTPFVKSSGRGQDFQPRVVGFDSSWLASSSFLITPQGEAGFFP